MFLCRVSPPHLLLDYYKLKANYSLTSTHPWRRSFYRVLYTPAAFDRLGRFLKTKVHKINSRPNTNKAQACHSCIHMNGGDAGGGVASHGRQSF